VITIVPEPIARANRSCQPLTILCIEDDPAILNIYARRLASIAQRVLCAASGQDGYAIAIEASPGMILLDNDLPDAKGIDILKRLASHPATAEIPVLMVTGLATAETRRILMAQGVIDFFEKPIDFEELSAQVRRLATVSAES
jgi:DNA-binding response OmpR family regulator